MADRPDVAAPVLGRLRSELAQRLNLIEQHALAYCWIVQFPWFEWDERENRVIDHDQSASMEKKKVDGYF